jgi:hypothetical protein
LELTIFGDFIRHKNGPQGKNPVTIEKIPLKPLITIVHGKILLSVVLSTSLQRTSFASS